MQLRREILKLKTKFTKLEKNKMFPKKANASFFQIPLQQLLKLLSPGEHHLEHLSKGALFGGLQVQLPFIAAIGLYEHMSAVVIGERLLQGVQRLSGLLGQFLQGLQSFSGGCG